MANLISSLALTDLTERTFIKGSIKVLKVKSLENKCCLVLGSKTKIVGKGGLCSERADESVISLKGRIELFSCAKILKRFILNGSNHVK